MTAQKNQYIEQQVYHPSLLCCMFWPPHIKKKHKKTEMEWGWITLSQVGISGKLLLALPCTDTDSVSFCSSGNSSERWLHQSLVCHEDLPHTQHPHHHDLVLETHHPHEQTSCPAREVRPPHYQHHSDDLKKVQLFFLHFQITLNFAAAIHLSLHFIHLPSGDQWWRFK